MNEFNVGDLIAHTLLPSSCSPHNLGIVVKISSFARCIKVCWADTGTFWVHPSKLKLIAKGKKD